MSSDTGAGPGRRHAVLRPACHGPKLSRRGQSCLFAGPARRRHQGTSRPPGHPPGIPARKAQKTCTRAGEPHRSPTANHPLAPLPARPDEMPSTSVRPRRHTENQVTATVLSARHRQCGGSRTVADVVSERDAEAVLSDEALAEVGALLHAARTPSPIWRFLMSRAGLLVPLRLPWRWRSSAKTLTWH